MTYNVLVTKEAQNDLKKLLQSEQQAYKKALKLIAELYEHPRTGTGKPEQLTGNRSGQWSRRISNKHRLVYEIHDTEVVFLYLPPMVIMATNNHY